VTQEFGGPDSKEKREWLAAEIVRMALQENSDEEDLEDVLIQVMSDEFEVLVEDDSAFNVARRVVQIRESVANGDFEIVERLKAEYEKGGKAIFTEVDGGNQETDGEDEDEEMEDVPQLVTKQKVMPEIDEDGFTKVVKRR
jgi:pre-rRNA-processing protein TSR2